MNDIDYNQVFLPIEPVIDGSHWDRKEIALSVEICDMLGRPDCRVGHFGHNFYFRTAAGMAMQKYTSLGRLKAAVEKRLAKAGLPVLRWQPAER